MDILRCGDVHPHPGPIPPQIDTPHKTPPRKRHYVPGQDVSPLPHREPGHHLSEACKLLMSQSPPPHTDTPARGKSATVRRRLFFDDEPPRSRHRSQDPRAAPRLIDVDPSTTSRLADIDPSAAPRRPGNDTDDVPIGTEPKRSKSIRAEDCVEPFTVPRPRKLKPPTEQTRTDHIMARPPPQPTRKPTTQELAREVALLEKLWDGEEEEAETHDEPSCQDKTMDRWKREMAAQPQVATTFHLAALPGIIPLEPAHHTKPHHAATPAVVTWLATTDAFDRQGTPPTAPPPPADETQGTLLEPSGDTDGSNHPIATASAEPQPNKGSGKAGRGIVALRVATLNTRGLPFERAAALASEANENDIDFLAVTECHADAYVIETDGCIVDIGPGQLHSGVGLIYRSRHKVSEIPVPEEIRNRLRIFAIQGMRRRVVKLAVAYYPHSSHADEATIRAAINRTVGEHRPTILAGDLNAAYEQRGNASPRADRIAEQFDQLSEWGYADVARSCRAPAWTWVNRVGGGSLTHGVTPPNTDDARIIRRRLDYIFVKGPANFIACNTQWTTVPTDHRMVIASIRIFRWYPHATHQRPAVTARKARPHGFVAPTGTRADALAEQLATTYDAFTEAAQCTDKPPPQPSIKDKMSIRHDTTLAIADRDAAHLRWRELKYRASADQRELDVLRSRYVAARRVAATAIRRDMRRAWRRWCRDTPPQHVINCKRKGHNALDNSFKPLLRPHFASLLGTPPPSNDDVWPLIDGIQPLSQQAPERGTPCRSHITLATDASVTQDAAGCAVVGDIEFFWKPDMPVLPSAAELEAVTVALEAAAASNFHPAAFTVTTDCKYARMAFHERQRASALWPGPDGELRERLHGARQHIERQGSTVMVDWKPRRSTPLLSFADNCARLSRERPRQKGHLPPHCAHEYNGVEDAVPTRDEVLIAIAKASLHKAVGPDGFQLGHIKKALQVLERTPPNDGDPVRAAARALVDTCVELTQHVYMHAEVPTGWKCGEIIALPKVAKPKDGNDLRGITLLSHVMKLTSAVLAARLAEAPLGLWQAGFRPKRNTAHAILALQACTETLRAAGRPTHMIFIDCTKAFDSVPRDVVPACVQKAGVGSNTSALLRALYAEDHIRVRGAEDETPFQTTAGVKQGDNLSPVLFTMVLDVAIRLAELTPFNVKRLDGTEADMGLLGYADDLVLVHDDPTVLQHNFDKLAKALAAFNLHVNYKKTESMTTTCPPPIARSLEALRARKPMATKSLDGLGIRTADSDKIAEARCRLEGETIIVTFDAGTKDAPKTAVRCPICPLSQGLAAVFDIRTSTQRGLRAHLEQTHGFTQVRASRTSSCATCGCTYLHHHHAGHCEAARKCIPLPQKRYLPQEKCPRCPFFGYVEHVCVPVNDPPQCRRLRCDTAAELDTRREGTAVKQAFKHTEQRGPDSETRVLKQVTKFRYLGRIIDDKCDSIADIRAKVARGKGKLALAAPLLKHKHISRRRKAAILSTFVWSTVLYASETWTVRHDERKLLRGLQTRAARWILRLRPVVETRPPTTDEIATRLSRADDNTSFRHCVRPVITSFQQLPNRAVYERLKNTPGFEPIDLMIAKKQLKFALDVSTRNRLLPESSALVIAGPTHDRKTTYTTTVAERLRGLVSNGINSTSPLGRQRRAPK